jgi:hypothetical protein
VQVTAAVFLNVPTLLCKVSGVIRGTIYFSGLFFNNFPFVYACSNFTNSLREGRVESSVLFYVVANLRKPRQTVVISLSSFATHFGTVTPLKPE